jgi:hypothetical protein
MESIRDNRAMTHEHPAIFCALFLMASLTLQACNKGPTPNSTESGGRPIAAEAIAKNQEPASTSAVAPPTKPFSGVATPVRDYPRVASSGRCAPIYKNGMRGNCIADKPCRGYGIRTDDNQVLCMCYLTHGGCEAKSRCDDRAHACLADTTQKVSDE